MAVVSVTCNKTNRARLRAMSNEEIADWFYNTVDDFPPWCDESRGHHGEPNGCEKCMVDWLEEEATDGFQR